ncbi:hypothetical protein ALC62_03904, partial [Cyphomyrmex costatus]
LRISVGSSACNLVLDICEHIGFFRKGCPRAFVEPSSSSVEEEELGMLQILLTRYRDIPTWDKSASKEETDTGRFAKRSDDKAKSVHREIITGEITHYKPDEV